MTSTPTNLQIDRASLSGRNGAGYQLTDNLATFYGALINPGEIGAVTAQLASGPVYETIDVRTVTGNSYSLVSGNVYLYRIWLPRGLPVTNITWFSGATGLTAGTAIHYWAALYASAAGVGSGAPLAQSTDNTAPTIAASAMQSLPLSAPYVITANGNYYLALSLTQTGGTMPSAANFGGVTLLASVLPKQGYNYVAGYNSGTAPTLSGAGAAGLPNQIWMGVS